jgi:hypothetical protein
MPPSGIQRIKTERLVDHLVEAGLSALPDLVEARRALDQLGLLGGDRAVFAACVLTLEMALLKDARAREDLPDYVGVLLEAFHDPRLANLLLAGSPELEKRWQRIRPVVADFVALKQGQTPPPARLPTPARPNPRLATPTELIQEIEEILEVDEATLSPPPPPAHAVGLARPPPPRPDDDPPVDPETREFWLYAERALGRVPDPNESLVGNQSFAAARGTDRSRLMRFAHDLVARFPSGKHARALASLTLLYVAGQEKERGLLGVNKERLKIMRTGLSLLGDPDAAGQVAVLFENDGVATRAAFGALVDIVGGYLAFCARERLDPHHPDALARFTRP